MNVTSLLLVFPNKLNDLMVSTFLYLILSHLEMVECMKSVAKMEGPELSIDERKLLYLAYKNFVGIRRRTWEALTDLHNSFDPKEVEHLDNIMSYRSNIEKELKAICDDVLSLLDHNLIPRVASGESKAFYLRMKGDYFRYLAEFVGDNDRAKIVNQANEAYQEATVVASAELSPSQPTRLGIALSYSVLFYEIMNQPKKACALAKKAINDALAEIDTLSGDSYRESTDILEKLRENIDFWKDEIAKKLALAGVRRGGESRTNLNLSK